MNKGASVPDQALAVPVEPVARLDPSGLDPSRSESRCDDCGGVNPVWFAPNALWNLVMGGRRATVDHVIPVSRGGQTRYGDVVAACSDCNCAKGSMLADVFRESVDARERYSEARAEMWRRANGLAASGIETEGQDGETRLGAKHESPTEGDAQ